MTQYNAQVASLTNKQSSFMKEFQSILASNKLDMTAKQNAIRSLEQQYGKQTVHNDNLNHAIDRTFAEDQNFQNMIQRHGDVVLRLAATASLQQKQNLTPDGQWMLENQAAGGYTELLNLTSRRYGGANAVNIANQLGKYYREHSLNPMAIPAAKKKMDWLSAGGRFAETKKLSVERLTGSVDKLFDRIISLRTKAFANGLTDTQFENMTLAEFKKQFGDRDYAQLVQLMNAAGIQYQEAITMPGSMAQMHEGARDWAQSNFKPTMPMANILGSIDGMRYDMKIQSGVYNSQIEEAQRGITELGPQIPAPGAPPEPAAPAAPGGAKPSIEELLKKYGK
jgi:hypothetical protein